MVSTTKTPPINPCERCSTPVESMAFDFNTGGMIYMRRLLCDKCETDREEERQRKEKEDEQRQRDDRWHEICPELYRNTDPARLPQSMLSEVVSWQYGPTGLLITGSTGAGKTRCVFQLLHRLNNEDRTIMSFTAAKFRAQVQSAAMDGSFDKWMRAANYADVLFFDDLGQMKMTETGEETLLSLIELRVSHCKPCIITTQYKGQELAEQFLRPQRGEAVVRRLREFCKVVTA